MATTGENIRALREEAGYTQVKLAELSGIGKNYLSDIETGKRNPGRKSIEGLCDALAVDEQTLLYGKEKKPQNATLRLVLNELEGCLEGRDEADAAIMAGEFLKFIREQKGQRS